MLLRDLVTADVTLPERAGAIDIKGITADSRSAAPGFLFAALPGSLTDGVRFVADAAARGAVAVLCNADAGVTPPPGVALIRTGDARRALALAAARFYPRQPKHLVAVTGTSRKDVGRRIRPADLRPAGHEAASIGTIGIVSRRWSTYGNLTTPDPVAIHEALDRLAREGVTHAAIEASSHGLDQRRLDGIRIGAAGFTNLGRDHMDYHPDVEDYLAAKLRLFTVILPKDGVAVVDMDDGAFGRRRGGRAAARRQRLTRVGRNGREIRIKDIRASGFEQRLGIEAFGRPREVVLPLAGAFQASNALVAAGLAIAAGVDEDAAFAALAKLGARLGGWSWSGGRPMARLVFVDYAHKPDAVTSMLRRSVRSPSAGS